MGMFDTIKQDHYCACGNVNETYQTKSLGSFLNEFILGDNINQQGDLTITIGSFEIYDFCASCKQSTTGRAYIKDELLSKIVHIENGLEKVIAQYTPGTPR